MFGFGYYFWLAKNLMIQPGGWMRTYVSCKAKCSLPIYAHIFPVPKPPKRLVKKNREYPYTFVMYADEKEGYTYCSRCDQYWKIKRFP